MDLQHTIQHIHLCRDEVQPSKGSPAGQELRAAVTVWPSVCLRWNLAPGEPLLPVVCLVRLKTHCAYQVAVAGREE